MFSFIIPVPECKLEISTGLLKSCIFAIAFASELVFSFSNVSENAQF